MQTVQQQDQGPSQGPMVVSPSPEQILVQLPPCSAGRVREVIGSTQLALEDLPLDDIPDVAVTDISDRQLATYLCQ